MSKIGDFIWYSTSMGGRTEQGEEGERNGNRKKEKQKEGKNGIEAREGEYGLGEGKQRYKGKGFLTF